MGLAKNNTKGGQGSGLLEPLGARGGPQRPFVGLVWTLWAPRPVEVTASVGPWRDACHCVALAHSVLKVILLCR